MKSISSAATICLVLFFVGESEMKTHNPSTGEELQKAINEASSGDLITLKPIDYSGNFKISKNGPITIEGTSVDDKSTVVKGSSGIAFDLKGNSWTIEKMSVVGYEFAFKVEGNENKLQKLSVRGVKKGFVIKGNKNLIDSSKIESSDTGITIEKGEGNNVKGCSLSSLSIFDGVTKGEIQGTKISGSVNVKGNHYTFNGVNVQGDVDIQGCDNQGNGGAFRGASHIASCNNFNNPSNAFEEIHD